MWMRVGMSDGNVAVAVGACVYLRMCVRMNDNWLGHLAAGCWVGAARAGYFTVEHPRL